MSEKDTALYDDGHGGLRSVHMDTGLARKTLEKIGPLLEEAVSRHSGVEGEPVEVEFIVAHDKGWRQKNLKGFFPGTL